MCGGDLGGEVFPFSTRFNGELFSYRQCTSCRSVIVSPVPSAETFARMYAKDNYHDNHYTGVSLAPYQRAATLLARHLPPGALVMDYGCGAGAFLSSLKSAGLKGFGVEFDPDAARQAAAVSGFDTCSVAELEGLRGLQKFDAIHLGDVLEHMPDPKEELTRLLQLLRPGGVLFLEGPLETQASPVYWAARLFGAARRAMGRRQPSQGAPTHLIRTHAWAQRRFVDQLAAEFKEQHWRVYETGWPYAFGGRLQRGIAAAARMASTVGGALGLELGNRFEAIYVVQPSAEVARS
jgi:SAM-dependent methyltransferase